ncbi:MAG: hypothetical protein FGM37_04585 [Phycisphaerales bacterium]|nr:hypothetical protein [Phycisphaerales bacterium]
MTNPHAIALTCALTLLVAGCGESSTTQSAQQGGAPSGSAAGGEGQGHDHSGDGAHDHSHDREGEPAAPDTQPQAPATEPAASTAGDGLPEGLMLARRPLGAVGVATARMGVRPGEPISVIGRIGGSRSPIVSNRAVFTLVDPAMKCCLETGDEDHCPRPWDYCCSDRAQLAASMATIEICGPDGKPLALSLEKEGTLRPLTLIAVNGILEAPDGSGSFVIRARGIYLMPNDPLADRIKALKQ